MNKNHESQLFSTPGKMRAKYLKDGVVFPIKVFDDNLFTNLKCVEKYQEFRKNCEINRTVPDIDDNKCNRSQIASFILIRSPFVRNDIYL